MFAAFTQDMILAVIVRYVGKLDTSGLTTHAKYIEPTHSTHQNAFGQTKSTMKYTPSRSKISTSKRSPNLPI